MNLSIIIYSDIDKPIKIVINTILFNNVTPKILQNPISLVSISWIDTKMMSDTNRLQSAILMVIVLVEGSIVAGAALIILSTGSMATEQTNQTHKAMDQHFRLSLHVSFA
jgi:hypothetical protein